MKKKFTLFLAVIMMAVAGQVSAAALTASQALSRLFNENAGVISSTRRIQKADRMILAYTSSHEFGNSYYVFNCGQADGFMILGADDTMPAVLGYCDKGSFDYNNIPSNMKWFLSLYDAEAMKRIATQTAAAPRAATRTAISPLLGNVIWDQAAPFNNQCPVYKNEKAATGCVATAMAQVMKYYQWPTKGTGTCSYSYDFDIDGTNTTPMSITNYSFAHTLDWANMLDDYTGSYTTAQGNAVATLMKDCGVAAQMIYGSFDAGGSAAFSDVAVEGMKKYLSYDAGMKVVYMEDGGYTQTTWDQLIYTELSNKRPVILGGNGKDGSGGHEFVCDGFDGSGKFHINWGWSGSCNGFFLLSGPGLIPEETGSGGAEAGASYGYQLEAIIGIKPNYPTGIETVATSQPSGVMFNLAGQRINKAQKGIYIVNGKKVLK